MIARNVIVSALVFLALVACMLAHQPKSVSFDLVCSEKYPGWVMAYGLSGMEQDNGIPFRWVSGNSCKLKIFAHSSKRKSIYYRIMSPLPQQTIQVFVEGSLCKSITIPHGQKWLSEYVEGTVVLEGKSIKSEISFELSDWNNKVERLLPDDRQLSVVMMELRLEIEED